jgi:cold shock protein
MDRQKPPDVVARETAPEPPEPLYTRRTSVGLVKRWSDAKGHGVIATAETAPWDVWCHFSAVDMPGFKTLRPGERVEVEYVRSDRLSFKYVADRVRPLEAPPAGEGSRPAG